MVKIDDWLLCQHNENNYVHVPCRYGRQRSSLHTSQVSYQAAAYPGFCRMNLPGVFLLLAGWDASPSQGYPQY